MQTQVESDQLNRRLTPNFRAREFVCPCCKEEGIKQETVIRLQAVHGQLPPYSVMIINSGYRCEKHNKEVKGSPTSSHCKGLAVDIKCGDAPYRFHLIQALIRSGFTRLGIGENFIHADLDWEKKQNLIWTYN